MDHIGISICVNSSVDLRLFSRSALVQRKVSSCRAGWSQGEKELLAGNAICTIEIGEISDYLGLEMHGATRDTIIHHLYSLADRSDSFGRVSSIRKVSALHFLDGDLHVLDQGQVYEALCDGRELGVARYGEGPLVALEDKVHGV